MHDELLAPRNRPDGTGIYEQLMEHLPPSSGAPPSVIGFKVFYYHLQSSQDWDDWRSLIAAADVRVIHLKRLNILRTHLSRERATRTNEWYTTTGTTHAAQPITLDYDTCVKEFDTTRRSEEAFDRMLMDQGTPVIQVLYEELASDFPKVMASMQDFLGIEALQIDPPLKKQAQAPLSVEIANYVELKRRFEDTEWASFFED